MEDMIMADETKNDKFKRLAEARTQKLIDGIRLLGNLSNTYIYDYRKEEVDKIFGTLEDELKAARSKFVVDTKKASKGDKFTL